MTYDVVLQQQARQDIWQLHAWIAKGAPQAADRWLEKLQARIAKLEVAPERCPLVAVRHRLSFDVRELLYGRKPYVFRIVFVIDGTLVRVLRVRRGQRRNLSAKDLSDAFADDERLSGQ